MKYPLFTLLFTALMALHTQSARADEHIVIDGGLLVVIPLRPAPPTPMLLAQEAEEREHMPSPHHWTNAQRMRRLQIKEAVSNGDISAEEARTSPPRRTNVITVPPESQDGPTATSRDFWRNRRKKIQEQMQTE